MKIISWNVNGIRSVIGQNARTKFGKTYKKNYLHQYIEEENPDIICIQETKSEPDQINEDLRYPEGYNGYFHSCRRKKGYSGVVTYSKQKPINVYTDIGIEKFDEEGRIIATEFEEFVLFNIYFPNGTSGQERVDFKLEFYDAVFAHFEDLRKQGKELIICGDYNTAHMPIDLARPKENEKNSGFLPEERVKIDWMIENGYIDSFRMFNQEGDQYTWWSNRGRARENNVGWRIDYHMITPGLKEKVVNSYHHPEAKGSDHCPIIIELK